MMADHGLLSTSRAKGINLNQGAILDGAPSTFDNDRTHHSHGFLRVSSKHSQHARLAWSSVNQLQYLILRTVIIQMMSTYSPVLE